MSSCGPSCGRRACQRLGVSALMQICVISLSSCFSRKAVVDTLDRTLFFSHCDYGHELKVHTRFWCTVGQFVALKSFPVAPFPWCGPFPPFCLTNFPVSLSGPHPPSTAASGVAVWSPSRTCCRSWTTTGRSSPSARPSAAAAPRSWTTAPPAPATPALSTTA